VDTSGGAIKVNHYGAGDGIYVAANTTGSTSYESASYVDGTKGFISTVQAYTPFYTTLFNALWANASVPGYGMYLADQAPGNAFTAKQFAGLVDSNQPMFAVVNPSLIFLGGLDTFGNYLSGSTNPAVSGKVRLANTDAVKWRNAANSADLPLGVSTVNQLSYNGNNVPVEVIQILSTGLVANYNAGTAKTLFTPTAAGMWEIKFVQAISRAATTSCTFPSLTLSWTDAGSVVRTATLVASNTTNATTNLVSGVQIIYTNGSTAVKVTSASYGSVGTTTMAYSLGVTAVQL